MRGVLLLAPALVPGLACYPPDRGFSLCERADRELVPDEPGPDRMLISCSGPPPSSSCAVTPMRYVPTLWYAAREAECGRMDCHGFVELDVTCEHPDGEVVEIPFGWCVYSCL